MKKTMCCFFAMLVLAGEVFSANPGAAKRLQAEANGIVITTSIPDTLYADSFYTIPLTATYSGNGTLAWTILKEPANMQEIFDTLIWSPTLANVGKDTIILSVSDGSVSDTLKKPIMVLAAPTLAISAVFPDTFYVDSLYSIHLTATHAGSAKLTWTIVKKPSGMQDISNTLIWAPGESDIGNDTIIISVSNDSTSDTLIKPIVVASTAVSVANLKDNSEPMILSARVARKNGSMDLLMGIPRAENPNWEIGLYDLSGKVVYKDLFSGCGYHRVSLASAELKRGFYIIRVSNGLEVLTRKAFFM